jgi:hypothetical protein
MMTTMMIIIIIMTMIPEGKRPLGRPRIILRWIFRKWYVGVWTESRWLSGGGNL